MEMINTKFKMAVIPESGYYVEMEGNWELMHKELQMNC